LAQKLNKFRAKLNSTGSLAYNKEELAKHYKETYGEKGSDNEDVELIVLSVKKQNKSKSKINIASDKISQVEFLSKKLNLDGNSTFLLLSSYGSFKK
jgi:transcriptional regulator NrdR family protein